MNRQVAAGLQIFFIGRVVALAVLVAAAHLRAEEPIPQPRTSGGCPVESRAFYECAMAQAKTFKVPRTAEGRPDFQGFWRSRNNGIAYDVEPGPGSFSVPPTAGEIIDPADKKIPYQPWAVAKRNELRTKGFEDPQGHCAPSGAPRKNNTLFGWRIIQPKGYVTFLYESMHDYRIIPTDGRKHLPASIKTWHGDPVGHWEGDTLVVDSTNFNGKPWLNEAGEITSHALHVVERFTPVNANTIIYRATLTDPIVYTRPFTVEVQLNRDPEGEMLEVACHEDNQDLAHMKDVKDAGVGLEKK